MTEKLEKGLNAILIVIGDEELEYTNLIDLPNEKLQILAVADPIKSRRDFVRDKYSIPDRMCFENWRSLLELGKIADLAVITDADIQYLGAVMAAIYLHYDLLFEKSITFSADEIRAINFAARKNNVRLITEKRELSRLF